LNPFGHGLGCQFYTPVVARGNLCVMDTSLGAIAVLFPGQGSQSIGMADPWTAHPAGHAALQEASDAMGQDVVAGCRDEARLQTTAFVQPALLACDVAAYRVLEAVGLTFAGVAGHSLGEFAALVAAGVLTLGEALSVVVVRGRAMQRAGEERPGTMTALLGVDGEAAAALCDEARGDGVLVVANENSPVQSVISGSIPAIERAESIAAARKVRAVRLNVAGAFHSPLMEPAVEPILAALAPIEVRAPVLPVAENVAGDLVRDGAALRELIGQQVVSPVRWVGCARALAGAGVSTFVEAGPGDVLTKLAKRVVPGARAVSVGSPTDAQTLSSAP
jgi:[acyl-carrier-protein] S-malonyltransferase